LSDFTLFRYFENVNLRMISMVMDTRLFDEWEHSTRLVKRVYWFFLC
jgi:hypothetical protein